MRAGIFDSRKEWLVMLAVLFALSSTLWTLNFLFDLGLGTVPAAGAGVLTGILMADLVTRGLGRRRPTIVVLVFLWVFATGSYLFAPYSWLYAGGGSFFSESDETYFNWFVSGVTYGLLGGAASLVARFAWGNRTADDIRANRRALLRTFSVVAGVLVLALAASFGFYLVVEHVIAPLVRYFA